MIYPRKKSRRVRRDDDNVCTPQGISKTLPLGEKETYRSISRSFRSTSPRFLFPFLSVSFRRVGGGRWNRNISARRTRICCFDKTMMMWRRNNMDESVNGKCFNGHVTAFWCRKTKGKGLIRKKHARWIHSKINLCEYYCFSGKGRLVCSSEDRRRRRTCWWWKF